jgi:hypothetical protein
VLAAQVRRLCLLGTAAALLAGLLTWLVWGLYAPHRYALAAPPAVHHSAPPRSLAAAAQAVPARLPASPPVRIIIPSIGVDAPVIPEGLDRQHALEMPPLSAHNLAGWYSGSALPGQTGPSVIAGHVDSTTGLSVFFHLRYLKPGAQITIEEAGHHTVRFTVQWVQEASKTTFPTQAVYGHVPYPALRVLTCGGPFDYATGHYLDNIIVYASIN